MKDIIQVASVMLFSLGTGGAIVFALSSWLGKVWANRLMAAETAKHSQDLERLRQELTKSSDSYKVKLRKSELIFEKEFEAASELVALIQTFYPKFRHPDMDWSESCAEIAFDLDKIENSIKIFLSKHGAVLPTEVKRKLATCNGIASDNKFFPESAQEMSAPDYAIDAVDRIFKELWRTEEIMLEQVHSQVST